MTLTIHADYHAISCQKIITARQLIPDRGQRVATQPRLSFDFKSCMQTAQVQRCTEASEAFINSVLFCWLEFVLSLHIVYILSALWAFNGVSWTAFPKLMMNKDRQSHVLCWEVERVVTTSRRCQCPLRLARTCLVASTRIRSHVLQMQLQCASMCHWNDAVHPHARNFNDPTGNAQQFDHIRSVVDVLLHGNWVVYRFVRLMFACQKLIPLISLRGGHPLWIRTDGGPVPRGADRWYVHVLEISGNRQILPNFIKWIIIDIYRLLHFANT